MTESVEEVIGIEHEMLHPLPQCLWSNRRFSCHFRVVVAFVGLAPVASHTSTAAGGCASDRGSATGAEIAPLVLLLSAEFDADYSTLSFYRKWAQPVPLLCDPERLPLLRRPLRLPVLRRCFAATVARTFWPR